MWTSACGAAPRKYSRRAKHAHSSPVKRKKINNKKKTQQQKNPQTTQHPFLCYSSSYSFLDVTCSEHLQGGVQNSRMSPKQGERPHRNGTVSSGSGSRNPCVTPRSQLQQALQGRGNKHDRCLPGPRAWSLAVLLSTTAVPSNPRAPPRFPGLSQGSEAARRGQGAQRWLQGRLQAAAPGRQLRHS